MRSKTFGVGDFDKPTLVDVAGPRAAWWWGRRGPGRTSGAACSLPPELPGSRWSSGCLGCTTRVCVTEQFTISDHLDLTLGQGRCFCMHKFLLCLSREGKQDCYIGSVDIKVNCLPRRRSGGVFFLRLLCLIWDKC